MRFLRLARVHFRMAARQRALWLVSLALALLSMSTAVNTGLAFESGEAEDLVFLAQVLAMLPPVACAAAFTELASEPERLGVSEVEASAPVHPAALSAARVAGALSVMVLPSAAVLVFCGGGQAAHGNVWGVLQAIVLLLSVVAPAALLAAALSALAGSLLPRALARIAAVVAWFALLAASLHGVPVPGGGIQFHIAADPVCQAFFGSRPYLDYQGPAVAATPLEALALLALKLAAAVALLAAAGVVARRRTYRRR